jgi:RNA polymerase sigma-70 factor, ECF subfamily
MNGSGFFNRAPAARYHSDVKQRGTISPPPASADESTLVAGCRAGEPASLDRFFRGYVAYVEKVIARLVGPTADLPDLVQSTFFEAIQSFDRYRGDASLKTWVTRIAVHVSLNQLRTGVRRNVPLELVPQASEPHDPARAADVQLSEHQLARRLYALLDRVAPKKRVAFLLYTVEGYSVEEVAALTGASRAAAKSRIWFARRELLAAARHREDLKAFMQTSQQATAKQAVARGASPETKPWR